MFEDLQMLLKPQYHQLWADYCHYLEMGWKRFESKRFSAVEKNNQLRLLEKAIRHDFPLSANFLARLQKQFVAENLSLYLLLEPLGAWRYAATEEKLSAKTDIILQSVAPAARLLMVLNDENPSTYLPMTSCLTAVFFAKAVRNKYPFFKISQYSSKQWSKKLDGLLKNSFILLQIIRSKRLKFKIAILLNTLQIWEKKLQNNKQAEIDVLDRMKIFLYSIYQFITIRRRTITKRGI